MKKSHPIFALQEIGQSVWLDTLTREMMNSGRLQQWIGEEVRGVTSNPTIFQKAISGSSDYDESIRRLLARGVNKEKDLFLELEIEDISRAADLLWPVYQSSQGGDGFVSVEVSPDLAYDTEGTIQEARLLFSAIGRKNIFVKVPATVPGLPAVEQLIREGVNVNITLLFAVERYEAVAEAYLRGLERRLKAGEHISDVASVASFFVSRVDALVDPLFEDRLKKAAGGERERIQKLLGRVAVSNAQLAYRKFQQIFSSRRFLDLEERGAQVQRVLWASTGTKNPKYSDLKYVEELIAPQTVNTMPEQTLQAFLDHGRARIAIADHLDQAEQVFRELRALGFDMQEITDQLEKEGVKLFSDSYFTLLRDLAAKGQTFQAGIAASP